MLDVSRTGQCVTQFTITEASLLSNPLNRRAWVTVHMGIVGCESWLGFLWARNFPKNPCVVIIFGLGNWTTVSSTSLGLHSNVSGLHSSHEILENLKTEAVIREDK